MSASASSVLLDGAAVRGAKLHRPAQHMSGGEQQRVAIARALAVTPKALTPKLHWQRELRGEYGIIEFEARPGAMGNATGHFTLYDGFTNIDGIHHDYWAQSKHIYFWKLPYD